MSHGILTRDRETTLKIRRLASAPKALRRSKLWGDLAGALAKAGWADFEPRAPASAAHTASPSGALQIPPVGRDLLTPSGR